MINLNEKTLSEDKEPLERLSYEINLLEPEEGIFLKSKLEGINLRIKSDSNETLFYALSQRYLEIIKKESNDKEKQCFWINFHPSEGIFLRSHQKREGLHTIGEKKGWSKIEFRPFNEYSPLYNSLFLPLKNFGKNAALYIYKKY